MKRIGIENIFFRCEPLIFREFSIIVSERIERMRLNLLDWKFKGLKNKLFLTATGSILNYVYHKLGF